LKLADFEMADSALKRLRGLMFRRGIRKPLVFIFPRKARAENAIHAFFVFFPFDAIFLDEGKRVVDVRGRIAPFTPLVVPRKPAKFLVEAGAGWAKRNGIRVGGKLYF